MSRFAYLTREGVRSAPISRQMFARYNERYRAATGQRMGTRRSFGALRQLSSGRWQARYPDPDRGNRLVPAPHTFAANLTARAG